MAAQPLETYDVNLTELIRHFRMKVMSMDRTSTARSFGWAVDSLEAFAGARQGIWADTTFTEAAAREWCVWMIFSGYARTTVVYYLSLVRTLLEDAVREGLTGPVGSLKELQNEVGALDEAAFDRDPQREVLKKFHNFVSGHITGGAGPYDASLRSDTSMGVDMVMFSILSGGIGFERLAAMKKTDAVEPLPIVEEIASRNARPRNRYMFSLDQSRRTPHQLEAVVTALFRSVLTKSGMRLSANPADTPLELWIRIAYELGIDTPVIKACAGAEAGRFAMLALVDASEVSPDEIAAARRIVYSALTEIRPEWYAFRFRQGVTYRQVEARLAAFGAISGIDDLYYPCEEIARRVGDNLVVRQQPVVAGLLFIRCRYVDVAAILRQAGDLMWCYTRRTDGRTTYAVIPDMEMYIYQTAISILLPDTELHPIGEIPLEPGDKVEIIGGSFNGRVGTVAPDSAPAGGRTIYRLLLPGGSGIEWIVDIPVDNLRRISPRQYTRRLTDLSRLTFS